jgi:anti-sigma B factor antagonist
MQDDPQSGQVDEFSCDVSAEDGGVLVAVTGELDIATARELQACLTSEGVLSAAKVRLDLANVEFLDSTGVGVIVTACKRARASGGSFSVVAAHNMVRSIIEIEGLVEYLQMEDD